MKWGWILLLPCISLSAKAQFHQNLIIKHTKEQQQPAAKPEAAIMPKTVNMAAKIMAHSFKLLRTKTTTRNKKDSAPAPEVMLSDAERVSEETILLQWHAPVAGTSATYVVERRFGDPHGDFDSVGMLKGHSTDPLHQAYQLLDKNDFMGPTYYRVKVSGAPAKRGSAPTLLVRGYQKGLRVFDGPGIAGHITITLHKFKITPNTDLYIRDANGSLVYQKKNVFFINSNTLQLTGIQLPKGIYQLEVANSYNTGTTAFTIR